jgi:undecaprenyl-diphosphatase
MTPPKWSESPFLLPVIILGLGAVWIPIEVFDAELFRLLNGAHTPASDALWLGITVIGDGLVLGILLGSCLIWNPRVTVLGLTLLILSSFFVHALKAAIPSLRPPELLDSVHVVGPVLRSGSFPSGHAAAGMAAALAIAHYLPSGILSVAILTGGALIGVSRVFVGVHFPGDVIAGVIISLMTYALLRATALSRIETLVPDSPIFSSSRFMAFYWLELTVAAYVIIFYAARFGWLSLPVRIMGCLICALLIVKWFRARRAFSHAEHGRHRNEP